MAGEIASAFVRIRPNMSGFQSETEAGVRSTFKRLAKIAGIAFGAKASFDFGKGIIEHAADIQKQIEVIKAEFGGASAAVLKFADVGAEKLGASAHVVDTLSAQLGILFKNLGIGPKAAAQMAVGFEKLGLSIAAIRGLDPATVLQNLPLAAAGNLRSLKQLGVATNAAQLQVAAFKLQMIDTVKQALTPAQRAIAIFAVATGHLPEFMSQAAAHAGDLRNRMRVLGAEWDNARDKLGSGLLPIMTKLVNALADRLPGAIDKVKSGFREGAAEATPFAHAIGGIVRGIASLASTASSVLGPIGGLARVLEVLLAAMAVNKIRAFAGAIMSNLVNGGFRQLRVATEAEKVAYLEAFGTMEVATIGLSATIKAALISTGIGALVVAIGFATEYVVSHWSQVKKVTIAVAHGIAATWGGLKTLLIGIAEATGGEMATFMTLPFRAILEAASKVSGLLSHIGIHIGGGAAKALDELKKFTTDLTKKGIEDTSSGGKQMADAFMNAFDSQMSLRGAQSTNIFGNLLGGLQAAIAKADANINKNVKSQIANIALDTRANVSSATNALQNLRDELSQSVTQEQIDIQNSVLTAKGNLLSIGQSLADSIGQILDKPFQMASQRIQDAQDRIALLFDLKNAKLDAEARKLDRLQSLLNLTADKKSIRDLRAQVLLPGGGSLSTDPSTALSQLKKLSKSSGERNKAAIDAFIITYQSAFLQLQQDQLGVKKAKIDSDRTVRETKLGLATDRIAIGQDAVAHVKETAARQISALTAAFNKGAISLPQFSKHLASLLEKDHVSYKLAGKRLGFAFAQGFSSQISGALAQALAISVGPQRPGTGAEPTIEHPLRVFQKDNAHIAKLSRDIGVKQTAIQTKIQKASEKTASLLQQMKDTTINPAAKALVQKPGGASKKAAALSGATG